MSRLLYKILGTPIGGFSSDKVPKDGDGDGKFTLGDEDNVPIGAAIEIARNLARKKVRNFVKENPERKERIKQILLKANEGGFTVEKTQKDDIVKGIAIGRNKHGIKKPASEMYDDDGQPTDEGYLSTRLHHQAVYGHGGAGTGFAQAQRHDLRPGFL